MVNCDRCESAIRRSAHGVVFERWQKLLACLLLFTGSVTAAPIRDSINQFEVDFESRALWYSISSYDPKPGGNESYWVRLDTKNDIKSTTLGRLWASPSGGRFVCWQPPGIDSVYNNFYVTESGEDLCVENTTQNPATPYTWIRQEPPGNATRLAWTSEPDWFALNVYAGLDDKWTLAIYHWPDIHRGLEKGSGAICGLSCVGGCTLGRHYTVQSGLAAYLLQEHLEADISVNPDSGNLRVVFQSGIENPRTVDETLALVEIPADEDPAITNDDAIQKRPLRDRHQVHIGETGQFWYGWKGHPRFSPNGKWLAYLATDRLQDESAEKELLVVPASGTKEQIRDAISVNVTSLINRTVTNFQWSCNSQCIMFQVSSEGDSPVFQANLKDGQWEIQSLDNPVVSGGATITQFEASEDGLELFALTSSLSEPPSVVQLQRNGDWDTGQFHCNWQTTEQPCKKIAQIQSASESVVEHRQRSVRQVNSEGRSVDYFVVSNSSCTATTPCPVVLRVHGGPNGVWESAYDPVTYALAEAGYVVVLPNPTGSIGYGQSFTDAVKKQWGGAAFDDVINVMNEAIDLPYVDQNRIYGMGHSYGGYLMNYFLVDGQSKAKTQPKFRFNAIVTNNGVWDLRGFACETDQPWFALDQLGLAYQDSACDSQELLEFNPIDRAEYLQNIPTLVAYSPDDRRVPSEFQNELLFEQLKDTFVDTPEALVLKGGHRLPPAEWSRVLEQSLKHFDAHQ